MTIFLWTLAVLFITGLNVILAGLLYNANKKQGRPVSKFKAIVWVIPPISIILWSITVIMFALALVAIPIYFLVTIFKRKKTNTDESSTSS